METHEDLAELLQKLEELLHVQSVRSTAQELDKLLADEFFELGVSGKIWTRESVIQTLKSESFSKRSMSDFKLSILAPEIALVTYRAHRFATEDRPSPTRFGARSGNGSGRDGRWCFIKEHLFRRNRQRDCPGLPSPPSF